MKNNRLQSLLLLFLFVMFIASCSSFDEDDNMAVMNDTPIPDIEDTFWDEDGTLLLKTPEEKVTLKFSKGKFTVDFSIGSSLYVTPTSYEDAKNYYETRGDLINRYKAIRTFYPAYDNMAFMTAMWLISLEYMLAQECFSDRCTSEERKAVLQLVVEKQKKKYEGDSGVGSLGAGRSGVFLMAVILAKERGRSAKIIDSETLQHALWALTVYDYDRNLILSCSEEFLRNY